MRGGVFVCHASTDAATAAEVVAVLERAGVPCWIAPRDIAPGENYTEAILEGLAAAPAVVLVFSAATNTSPHVHRELETVVGAGTRIIPLRVEAAEPSPALRYFIGTSQWLDLAGATPVSWQAALVDAARRVGGGEPAPPPTEETGAATPVADASRRRAVVPALAAGSVLLVVVTVLAVVFATKDDDTSDNDTTSSSSTSSSTSSSPSGPTPATSGSETSEPPSTSAASDTPAVTTPTPSPVTGEVVAADEFDETTVFVDGSYPSGGGTFTVSLGDGRLRATSHGIKPAWDSWVSLVTPSIPAEWSVVATVSSSSPGATCGVQASDGLLNVTADLDATGTSARISVYRGQETRAQKTFAVSGGHGPLSLSLESGVLVMRGGDAFLGSVGRSGFKSLEEGGVVTVGPDSECVFESLSARARS